MTAITNLIRWLILTSAISVSEWVRVRVRESESETDLQASLFSLPLSVLPDWLEDLEPVSVLVSCCWCSGSSSRAFLRQMAANSILATGIAADWPSLSKHKNKHSLGWFWARWTSADYLLIRYQLDSVTIRYKNSLRGELYESWTMHIKYFS